MNCAQPAAKAGDCIGFVGIFGFFANLLMLTGPLYMLQVYDRVLGSRSVETLIALSVLVLFLYGMMGLLDYARGRIMARVGARFQARLDRRVFDAVIRKSAVAPDASTATGLRDLEAIQRLMSSPVLTAMFDIPWTPLFLAGIWIFHPMLGILALAGGTILIAVTLINQAVTRRPQARANSAFCWRRGDIEPDQHRSRDGAGNGNARRSF